jgi:hypothetical protein
MGDVTMYRRILSLSEEIETALPGDDHAGLDALRRRRAAAFATIEGHGLRVSPEAIAVIEKIQECERRCRELALRKMAVLKRDMGSIRKGRRLEKAYGR